MATAAPGPVPPAGCSSRAMGRPWTKCSFRNRKKKKGHHPRRVMAVRTAFDCLWLATSPGGGRQTQADAAKDEGKEQRELHHDRGHRETPGSHSRAHAT